MAQLDVVVASVHGGFQQTADEMTARVIRALENPHVHILAHPTGRKVLGRPPHKIDLERVLPVAAKLGVTVEHNAAPPRADLNDLQLRRARELGCKLIVNSDAHATDELDRMHFGIIQLRRAWLTAADLINTLPVDDFLSRSAETRSPPPDHI